MSALFSQNGSVTLRTIGFAIILFIVAGFVELSSRFAFSRLVSPEVQNQIEALRHHEESRGYVIPNAIWHHDLNPKYNEYYTLTRWGTRGEDFEAKKPAGELRILAVGDSTTEGWKNKDNETYPYFLEQFLRARPSEILPFRTVKVINAGVGSHNTAFNLALFSQKLIHFDPDIVIFKSSYNDRQAYFSKNLLYDYTNVYQRPFTSEVRNAAFWNVAARSYALSLLGALTLDAPFQEAIGAEVIPVTSQAEFDANLSKISFFESNVRALVAIARAEHIQPILLDFPSSPSEEHYRNAGFRSDFDRQTFMQFTHLISDLSAKIGAEENIPFIKSADFLGAADFWDHCHNTASGNRKIGEAAAQEVIRHLRN